jgi:hypothetical protein
MDLDKLVKTRIGKSKLKWNIGELAKTGFGRTDYTYI